MFLELFKLVVYPAQQANTFIKPEYSDANGLQAHALHYCDVTLRFAKGCDFSIYNAPLLAAQQFFGACHHYGLATDKTNVVIINNGIGKQALWDSILRSLKAQQHLTAQKVYDSETLAASALEAVVALIGAYPERDALRQQLTSLREEVKKANTALDRQSLDITPLRAHCAELEVLVADLRNVVAQYKERNKNLELKFASREAAKPPRHGGCPAHYDLGAVGEVLDVCRELSKTLPDDWDDAFIGGMYLELVKYVLRAPRKNGIDDLRKSAHYIDIMITELTEVE